MKKVHSQLLSIVLGLALLAPAVIGQTPDSAPPAAPPENTASPPVSTPSTEEAKTQSPPAPTPSAPAAETSPAPAPAPSAPAPEPEPSAPVAPTPKHFDRAQVVTFGNAYLRSGDNAEAVVAIMGNAQAEGEVRDAVVAIMGNAEATDNVGDAVVAIMGNSRAEKYVGDSVVAIMGNAHVNGHVRGQVVAVMGNVELGPEARVDGEVVCVGGTVNSDPRAVVLGHVQQVPFLSHLPVLGSLGVWLHHALGHGRLLSFHTYPAWPWVIGLLFLGFYLLLSLAFGRTITRCAETLEQRPGRTLLAALLSLIAAPAAMVLLAFTIVGPLVFFLALVIALLLGKTALLAWIGRRFVGPQRGLAVALAVMIGGVVVLVLYAIPVVGLFTWAIGTALGLGMVVYTAVLGMRSDAKPTTPRVVAVPPSRAATVTSPAPAAAVVASTAAPIPSVSSPSAESLGVATAPVENATVPPVSAPPPLRVSATPSFVADPDIALPRAGFWPRLGASALDALVVFIFAKFTHLGSLFVLLLTLYHIGFYGWRGTTIGGIVTGLKIVRLDGRPIGWDVAVVRVLAAFLSFVAALLGFIWVAVDRDCQSWHDKIAGTTIVKTPKAQPLV